MSAGRAPRQHNPVRIDAVFLGVLRHPAKRAPHVFDGRGRQCHLARSVLDVHRVESHLQPWDRVEREALLRGLHAVAAAVEEQDGRERPRCAARTIDIQLEVHSAGGEIGDVRRHLVAGREKRHKGGGVLYGTLRDDRWTENGFVDAYLLARCGSG